MSKYFEVKCRLCRREGTKLFLKGEHCFSKCPLDKKGAVLPGQHGLKRTRRLSEYGLQLREKQKARRTYGVMERQFRNYFKRAFKKRGATGETLLQLLESRLDNVIYRLGFVPSRAAAKQLVSHGNVLVDGKRVDIPSYQVKPEQVISLTPKALKLELVAKSIADKKKKIPSWLQKRAAIGKIVSLPKREEIGTDIAEQLIVEYYSR